MKQSSSFQHEDIQGFRFGSDPFGKPRLFSYVYFVDGLLIDTGHRNMRKEVMEVLAPLPIDQVFLTHHHEDHTGNLDALQAHFPCPTYASTRCVEIMKNPPGISPAQRLYWGDRPPNFQLTAKEGRIQTPQFNFDIIPAPGHAADMVCLHEASKGWLFSADLWVYSHIRYFMRSESMKQQIASIRRVLELEFDVLLCSHNPQLQDGKQKLAAKLQFFEDFYGKVVALHAQGHHAPGIMREMGLKEKWQVRLLSLGELSTLNMVKSVLRDEQGRN